MRQGWSIANTHLQPNIEWNYQVSHMTRQILAVSPSSWQVDGEERLLKP